MVRFKSLLKIAFFLLFSFIILIFLGEFIFNSTHQFPERITYGVTFSPVYAKYLNLDWQKIYVQILDDLKVKNLRIPSYWNMIETDQGQYDFSETDYMISEADKRGIKVILVVGIRQPRWPECHVPVWAKSLPVDQRQKKALELVQKVIEKYKDEESVWAWQVENEPSLKTFGENCDIVDENFFKSEAKLVRSISNKPIIMTDSGELGFWTTSMELSDIFGTTLYRRVYNNFFGYTTYPLLPSFYRLKSDLIRKIFAPDNKKTIIVELQAEPWLANGTLMPSDQQAKLFTTEDFRSFINYSQKTGFDEVYLWGVEWWYFMAEHGYPEYLNYAKTLFR